MMCSDEGNDVSRENVPQGARSALHGRTGPSDPVGPGAPMVKYPTHTYTHTMTTRTINLSEESYTRLRSLKKDNESFSDVVNRITGKFLLLELAGILDKSSAERLRKAKRELDRRLRRNFRKASSGMA